MKNFKLLGIAFLALLIGACTDEDKLNLDVESLDTGAYLRTIAVVSGGYDFLNLDTAAFVVTVEEGDAAGGDELESMDVYVGYRDGDGDDDLDEVLVKNIPASAFMDGEDDLPRYTLTVTASEALAALGLTQDEVAIGDQFRFRLAVNTTDGQTFSNINSGGNVSGTFFGSPFRYNVNVACPLADDKFSGSYNVTLVEGSGPFGNFTSPSFTADVKVTSDTQRSIDLTYLPDIGGFGEALTFNFVCTTVSVVFNDTGLACGGSPAISYGQSDVPPVDFDIDDDSSFTLSFMDFIGDGGCGVPAYPVTLQFSR